MKAQGKREARRPGLPLAITPFQGSNVLIIGTRGDALRFASRLPLAVIFRAVGAPFGRLRQSWLKGEQI